MLIDRGTEEVRIQCGSCGAHALMAAGDYAELLAQRGGQMRCEVCGYRVVFEALEMPHGERPAVALS